MNNRFLKFFLGLFMILILVELMFVDRHNDSKEYYDIMATFNKVDGVNEGNLVMISGVNVGFVDKVLLNQNYPILKMKIKKNISISDDSSVSIQTDDDGFYAVNPTNSVEHWVVPMNHTQAALLLKK